MPEQRNRNEAFGRLLSGAINSIATYEGKAAPIIDRACAKSGTWRYTNTPF